jgi:hypothetical protein
MSYASISQGEGFDLVLKHKNSKVKDYEVSLFHIDKKQHYTPLKVFSLLELENKFGVEEYRQTADLKRQADLLYKTIFNRGK